MNLRTLTDAQLHSKIQETAQKHRAITLELLNEINEVERRHLYSKFKCSSIHDYCVRELKMTSGNAWHHMNAARLLREIPAIQEKVLTGAIAVTTISSAEAFFKKEARAENKFESQQKQVLLQQLQNKSTRDADKILLSNSSTPEIHFKEKLTPKSQSHSELKIYLNEQAIQNLERLCEIWSHAIPQGSLGAIIERAVNEAVEKHDPMKDIERAEIKELKKKTPALGITKSTADIRRAVWKRDQARCTFTDPRTGERCDAKHFIEEDHIFPKAMGGAYSEANIRLRCRTHNQRHAIDTFGDAKMRDHISCMQH